MSILLLALVSVLAADPALDDRPTSALTAIRRAAVPVDVQAIVDRFGQTQPWRDRNAVGKELAALVEPVPPAMLVLLQTTADPRLARDVLKWLREHAPEHSLTKDFILSEGLTSPDFTIRYESLWHVGEQHWEEARERLYLQMRDYHGEPYFRFVAAKSLAEFGDSRALRTLIEAVRNDRYMPRHFGNHGLQALTGRSLNDFGYNYGENAFVSGGVEATMLNPDPLETAETLAQRHTACRDYLKWLRDQKPELYEALTTRF
jgi:hypothetical protein